MRMLDELVRHRDLLWLLTVREVRIRYARAALGAGWAVFVPLLMMLIFTWLDFSRLIEAASPYAGTPYPLFAYCGLLTWAHFATSLTQATPSLGNLRELLRKSAFPREVIPLSKVLAALLDLAIGAVVLGLLMLHYRQPVSPSVLALPLVFLLQLAFTIGLALLLAAGNVYFRDVNYLLQIGIVLLMFASAVVYPLPAQEKGLLRLLAWNPMASYIESYRTALILGRWPGEALVPGVVGAVLAFGAGVGLFRWCSPHLPEAV